MSQLGQQIPIHSESAVYLAQLSGNAYLLDILKDDELEMAFKLNCLFFDELIIGAGSLIGSPFLYRLMLEEPETIKEMYSSRLIRPLLRENGKNTEVSSISDLGSRMMKNNTKTVFSNKSTLEVHANFIENAGAISAWGSETQYQDAYLGVLTYLTKSRLDLNLFPKNDRSAIIKLLDKNYKDGYFAFDSMSSLQRYLDENVSPLTSFEIKKQSEFAAQHACSLITATKLSMPEPISNYANLLIGHPKENSFEDLEEKHFSFPISIRSLTKFSMRELLRVRRAPDFVRLRKKLISIRTGHPVEEKEVIDIAQGCLRDLQRLVNSKDIEKEHVIKEIENKKLANISCIMFKLLGDVAVAYSIYEQIHGVDSQLSFYLGASASIGARVTEHNFKTHPESLYLPDTYVDVEEGVLRILNTNEAYKFK